MTKYFCDNCGKEASIAVDVKKIVKPKSKQFSKDCEFHVRVSFGFNKHPKGFGGPPDLCKDCKIWLIQSLLGIVP